MRHFLPSRIPGATRSIRDLSGWQRHGSDSEGVARKHALHHIVVDGKS